MGARKRAGTENRSCPWSLLRKTAFALELHDRVHGDSELAVIPSAGDSGGVREIIHRTVRPVVANFRTELQPLEDIVRRPGVNLDADRRLVVVGAHALDSHTALVAIPLTAGIKGEVAVELIRAVRSHAVPLGALTNGRGGRVRGVAIQAVGGQRQLIRHLVAWNRLKIGPVIAIVAARNGLALTIDAIPFG